MWLISTESLALEFFVDPPKGSYAVLSHTWDGGEVSFQEVKDLGNARKKKGFAKIERTCELARRRNLPYAWVDTCCIDKSSSAELSETINSMFQWYRESAVCFAFLSDLRSRPEIGSEPPQSDKWFEQSFPGCRWLRRGWTLQELIAPPHVEFYDMTWTMRTSKAAHTLFLSRETGIDVNVLEDSACLSQILISRRMSWAAGRETTRIEDMAYCLLGIFDINMPMIYGEGKKAFMRLQEEIAKQSCDLSLFAWRAQSPGQGNDFQSYRGIFARWPTEFTKCRQMRPRNRGPIEKEFTITNKGLRLEATLVNVLDETRDLVFNLGVCEYSDLPKNSANGWMGLYLTKTARGYVRARPHEMYTAGQERKGRLRCEKAVLHIRKDLSLAESLSLNSQYRHAIRFRNVTGENYCLRGMIQPEDLWDSKRMLFLDQGSGLNAFVVLKYPMSKVHQVCDFQVVIACSTMDAPMCVIWSEQDKTQWNKVLHHMQTSREITDYVAYDYLQRYFGEFAPRRTQSTCYFQDPNSGRKAAVEARLKVDKFEGMECFCIEVRHSYCFSPR
ncbi:hypothetical protein W97_08176 [Coniosporium apollinis CBS 100218]|uniref:Uncharacterized protein n=1 Tax=Coniosporium apollinis (strain CBS 100218) TaxID=1168221 RepID=R7Z488_CONA1|nr:uncharacterized protein W97_08176 [Coniosporium apollinis CBS 100218]EON68918.1 hypothetical protein W97_08176 [Coniosporium apollinis CBS 100218]